MNLLSGLSLLLYGYKLIVVALVMILATVSDSINIGVNLAGILRRTHGERQSAKWSGV